LTTDILRYSISLDSIDKVSSLSIANRGGLALKASDGKSIYYFGGYPSSTRVVHKFNSETNVTVRLPTALPSHVEFAVGVSNNETTFIFNGRQRNILEFNHESETAKIIGDLPFQTGTSTVFSTTAIRNGQEGVWLFAGNPQKATNPVLFFNTANKVLYIPTVNSTSLPTLCEAPVSVWDGSHGFIIGGLGWRQESDGTYHPTNGILT
jgi:N-acetylneuraminic acid mutarotase